MEINIGLNSDMDYTGARLGTFSISTTAINWGQVHKSVQQG